MDLPRSISTNVPAAPPASRCPQRVRARHFPSSSNSKITLVLLTRSPPTPSSTPSFQASLSTVMPPLPLSLLLSGSSGALEDSRKDHFASEERIGTEITSKRNESQKRDGWINWSSLPLSLPLLSWIAGLCREPAAPATHLLACLGSTHCGNSTYTGVLRAYIVYQKAKSLITFKSIWIKN